MKMSGNGKIQLTALEGCELVPYDDPAGYPTIGVGHLLTPGEKTSGEISINDEPVLFADGITQEQAMDLLARDLERFERAVNEDVTVDLTQNQFDALVSFAFNIGTKNFKESTLLRKLNQGKHGEVPDQMRRWVKAGGKTIQILVNRREKEIELWNG